MHVSNTKHLSIFAICHWTIYLFEDITSLTALLNHSSSRYLRTKNLWLSSLKVLRLLGQLPSLL